MKIDDNKKSCLRCKNFKLLNLEKGNCRKDRGSEYPVKDLMDSCEDWVDCGQNYFIRKGWLKGQQEKH